MRRAMQNLLLSAITGMIFLVFLNACRKSEYNTVPEAAYLRVFNTLTYKTDLSTKGKPLPFLLMVIDPEYDQSGDLIGGAVVGDFLDVRNRYALGTANAASTDYRNREFPGTLKVPTAPVINGFDLSAWAKVPSGEHRFVFYTRPLNPVPFFQLSPTDKRSQILIADTVLDLKEGKVYTMNILEQDVTTSTLSTIIYNREELFPWMAFADTLNYVNFYNLSAKGYVEAHPEAAVNDYTTSTGTAIKNNVNIFYSLYKDDVPFPYTVINNNPPSIGNNLVQGYKQVPLQNLLRSQDPVVARYNSVPLFPGSDTSRKIFSSVWMDLDILPPGVGVAEARGQRYSPGGGLLVSLCNQSDDGKRQIGSGAGFAQGLLLPSLVRQVASGTYQQRSVATISSIEFINKDIYLTSVLKIYEPPTR